MDLETQSQWHLFCVSQNYRRLLLLLLSWYYYYYSIIILIILNEIEGCHLSGSLSSYLKFQQGDQQIQYMIKGNIIPDA